MASVKKGYFAHTAMRQTSDWCNRDPTQDAIEESIVVHTMRQRAFFDM
jgi:hypothetical protein